jgi:hypothetical protein
MDLFKDWSSGAEPDSDNFIEQLKQIYAAVESEVMGLWDGTEPRAKIFEPECRSEVKKMLLKISEELSDKARNAELSRLDAAFGSAPLQATRVAVPAQRIRALEQEEPDSPEAPARPPRRGYRAEIEAFQRNHPEYGTNLKLARYLGINESALKSIKSDRGDLRCGPDTLQEALKKMGSPKHE